MDGDIPPDPYAALGVSKDADAATIKSTYRKLVLKCHPDKVTDESLKQQKQDEFHKIQSAYEIIGDEDKRATYDAQVKLAELRKEKLERTGGTPSRSSSYDYRSPKAAATATFSTPRYEERKPARAYDDDKYFDDRSTSRKYDGYEGHSKRPAARTARTEREPVRVSRTSEKPKSDHKKTKDREERRDRAAKFPYAEEDEFSDDKARYEREYRRRSDEARLRQEQDAEAERVRNAAAEARKKADEERRKSEEAVRAARRSTSHDRRSTSRDREDRFADERHRKLSAMEDQVKNYISTSRNTESRPQPSRTSSSRDARDYYDIRPRRPDAPRRSSARPRTDMPDGHRKISSFPEIVEWDDERKPQPPSFKHSVSSPADIKTVPRATPQRAHTMESNHERRRDPSPTPVFRRSETMPSAQSAPRRKESTPSRPSTLRNENVLPSESRRSSPDSAYPSIPSAQPTSATKKYYYATPGGGVTLAPEDIGSHRTVLREPEARRRQRSPSPLTTTRAVPAPSSSSRYPAAPPRVVPVRIPHPPLGRSATMSATSPERRPSLDTSRNPSLYGELDSDYLRRERARQQTSFAHDQINFAKKYGNDDIQYSSRGRDKERGYGKPAPLKRHETSVY